MSLVFRSLASPGRVPASIDPHQERSVARLTRRAQDRFQHPFGITDCLTLVEVLALHDDQIERYGGSAGVRDLGLV